MDGSVFGPSLLRAAETPAHPAGAPKAPGADPPSVGLPIVKASSAYFCPGEHHPISRAIHLARLAAFYPKCRTCEHRQDTGQIAPSTRELLEETAQRAHPAPLFREAGVEGVYLNQLSRPVVEKLGVAFADVLWDGHRLTGSPREVQRRSVAALQAALPRGPMIVIGHDSRMSSADLTIGLARALRRMECDVVDVGRVTRPGLDFAVDHLEADGGLFVGGDMRTPAWNGIGFVGRHGEPWSSRGQLDVVKERFDATLVRPTRRGGRQRFFDVSIPYQASFWKLLHDLPRFSLVCTAEDPDIVRALSRLLEPFPTELTFVDPPLRRAGSDLEYTEIETSVCNVGADLGVQIAANGQSLRIWDERGHLVPASALVTALACTLRPSSNAVVVRSTEEPGPNFIEGVPAVRVCVAPHAEAIVKTMRAQAGAMGCDQDGRIWFNQGRIICDAILTLIQVLQILHQTGQPCSQALWTHDRSAAPARLS